MLKKANVIMVTSDDAPITVTIDGEDILSFPKGAIVFNKDKFPSIKLIEKDEVVTPEMGYQRAYLHLVSEEDIEEGELMLSRDEYMVVPTPPKVEHGLKLLASTDKHLRLPKFSKKFLTKYVESQGIHKVFVVVEETLSPTPHCIPKVNRNNIISLRKMKNLFTRDEVEDIIFEARMNPDDKIDELLNEY